jgi:hypothetical protein
MPMTILRYAVSAAFILSLLLLTWQSIRTARFGKRPLFSRAAGQAGKGVIYAFGQGMMPWEKESARRHLPTYAAGMVYHGGIFSAIGWCFSRVFQLPLPGFVVGALQILMALGVLVGIGLLFKRLLKLPLRSISFPDDYLSNILVDVFLLSALLSTLSDRILPVFFVLAVITFLYMPLGKIRHCFFFFYSRILFGCYFGRRGVFPHQETGH